MSQRSKSWDDAGSDDSHWHSPSGNGQNGSGILNCAVCHTGIVVPPDHPNGQIIPGMPANTVDLQAFFRFLFRCAEDWRFNPGYLIARMHAETPLDAIDKALYRLAIPLFQGRLLARKARLKIYFGNDNGSVPTLAALLQPAAQRPSRFYLGDTTYLPRQIGFRHDRPSATDGRSLFPRNLYDDFTD